MDKKTAELNELDKAWVKSWFKECCQRQIKPWEWDFKYSYLTPEEINKDSPINRILNYRQGNLTEKGLFNSTNKTGKSADCDKEPLSIYRLLWTLDEHKVMRGETMNSFIRTFNNSILKSDNKESVYKKIHIEEKKKLTEQYHLLVKKENYKLFSLINENITEFETFSYRTHCIGNFTLLPHWMNTGRFLFSQDYWDITLQSLFDFLNPIGAWKDFVSTYYLQPFVNDDSDWTVQEFWPGHFSQIGRGPQNIPPQNSAELRSFLIQVNSRIEIRGKWIIKELCEKYELKNFEFYKDIKNLKFNL